MQARTERDDKVQGSYRLCEYASNTGQRYSVVGFPVRFEFKGGAIMN
jgi:hypothetical protein